MPTDIENQEEDLNVKDYRLRYTYNFWDSCGSICFGTCILLVLCSVYFIVLYFMNLKHDHDEDHITEYFTVRAGYWIDKDRWCSVEDPCKMKCYEYDRFDVQCAKDNLECTGGHYDSCSDSPVEGQHGWLS